MLGKTFLSCLTAIGCDGTHTGNGMGLPIAKGIVDHTGADLVESEVGEGTQSSLLACADGSSPVNEHRTFARSSHRAPNSAGVCKNSTRPRTGTFSL